MGAHAPSSVRTARSSSGIPSSFSFIVLLRQQVKKEEQGRAAESHPQLLLPLHPPRDVQAAYPEHVENGTPRPSSLFVPFLPHRKPWSPQASWVWPTLLLATAVAIELVAWRIMSVVGDFYQAVAGRDTALFKDVLVRSMGMIAAIAVSG